MPYWLDDREHGGDLCGFDCDFNEEFRSCVISKDREYSCYLAHLLNELEGKVFGCPYCN